MPIRPGVRAVTRTAIRIAALALAALAYLLACHWLMTRAQPSPWNAVGVLTPMLVAIGLGAWRGGQHGLGALASLAVAGLVAQALLGVQVPAPLLYLGQHAGIHLCSSRCSSASTCCATGCTPSSNARALPTQSAPTGTTPRNEHAALAGACVCGNRGDPAVDRRR